MLVKTLFFLLLIYLFIGVFRHFFEVKNRLKETPKIKKRNSKSISHFFIAEEIPFEEIENPSNEK